MRMLPLGRDAVLVEVGSLAGVLGLHARLVASPPPGVVDIVPAAETVAVHVDRAVLTLGAARAWIARSADAAAPRGATSAPVVLPVRYDGVDLEDVAAMLGTSAEAVVARHAATDWVVAFTGFAPGFGYLVGAGWERDIPRRASPRPRVPAGAVGLAGAFTGAYPRESPGGWQLIGTTGAPPVRPGCRPPRPPLTRSAGALRAGPASLARARADARSVPGAGARRRVLRSRCDPRRRG
ncbi:MAG: allophanate hydrolase subunit 1 [Microbacterium arborescens]